MLNDPPDRLRLESLEPWIEWRFDRASGPGGQNVNKVATRVTLLLDFENAEVFSDGERDRIRTRLATRIARDGLLRVTSQTERSQHANRIRAHERLVELLEQAFARRRTRRETRPTRASRERRLQSKKQRGDLKKQRRGPLE